MWACSTLTQRALRCIYSLHNKMYLHHEKKGGKTVKCALGDLCYDFHLGIQRRRSINTVEVIKNMITRRQLVNMIQNQTLVIYWQEKSSGFDRIKYIKRKRGKKSFIIFILFLWQERPSASLNPSTNASSLAIVPQGWLKPLGERKAQGKIQKGSRRKRLWSKWSQRFWGILPVGKCK